jgi:cyclic pyranopterin phosphate synthase
MPPEGVPKLSHADILSLEELGTLVAWLSANTVIERVKLTGGEPLVRKGVERLIAQLVQTEGIREVSMTTNGSFLQQMAPILKAAGLARVTVSLDSMDAARFAQLTNGGRLADTLNGIDHALDVGLTPLKLNAVLQRSSWKEEVPLLLDYAAAHRLELRFIELMRTGTERIWCQSEYVGIEEVCAWLGERGRLTAVPSRGGTPARATTMLWHGTEVSVGWIAPRSHPFCGTCERLRLDSRGLLHRCLMDSSTLDLGQMLRSQNAKNAAAAFAAYMAGKAPPCAMDSANSMSLIGG